MVFNPQPKPKIYKNERYLKFIRRFGEPHHVTIDHNAKGTGIKTNDYDTMPMHPSKHRDLHQMGQKTYFKNHNNKNPMHEIVYYLSRYVRLHCTFAQVMKMDEAELSLCRELLIKYIEGE